MTIFNICQVSGDSILLSDIVRGTCRYLLYGQVLGDYVEYVVSIWTSARQLCRLCCIDLVVILFIVEYCCN